MLRVPDEQNGAAPEGVDAFLERVSPVLLRLAGPLSASRADAEDLAQETLLRLLRHWSRVAAADDPMRYARRTLVNEAIRKNRRTHQVVELAEDSKLAAGPRNDGGVEGMLDSAEVRWLLGHLPANHRAAVVLRYLDDASYQEVAQILGCREVTARSWVSRGLKVLRAVHGGKQVPDTQGSQ